MPTLKYESAVIGGNQEVYNGRNAPSYSLTQSGTPMPTNVPVRIDSATLTFTMRDVWSHSIVAHFKGQVPFDEGFNQVGGVRGIDQRDPNCFRNIEKIVMEGNGGSAGTLKSGSTIIITVNWSVSTTACKAPTAKLSAEIAENSAVLIWSGASGGTGNAINGYDIEYSDSANGGSWSAWQLYQHISSGATSGSVAVSAPPTRGGYRKFRIRTTGMAGNAFASPYVVLPCTLRRNTLPSVPTGLQVSPLILESGSIRLTWQPSSDATGTVASYELQSKILSGDWQSAGSTIQNSATFSPILERGSIIRYRVRAVDSLGAASEWAEFVGIKRNLCPVLGGSVNASALVFENQPIVLSWQNATDGDNAVQSYQVSCSLSNDGKHWQPPIALGSVATLTFTHLADIPRGSYVRYAVTAADTLGALSESIVSAPIRKNQLPSAPNMLRASPEIYESGGIRLSWEPASDAEGIVESYVIQYALSSDGNSWNDWSGEHSSLQPEITLSPAFSRGTWVVFRVCAVDQLGARSAWVMSDKVMKNRTPAVPSFLYPVKSGLSAHPAVVLGAAVAADRDGQKQTIQYRLMRDGHVVKDYSSSDMLPAGGGKVLFPLPDLEEGVYTAQIRTMDEQGAVSTAASRTFTLSKLAWSRQPATGMVIADLSVSHQTDITELLQAVNRLRAWYGLEAAALHGVGFFGQWDQNMRELRSALEEAIPLCGGIQPTWTQLVSYPLAKAIRELQQAVEKGMRA